MNHTHIRKNLSLLYLIHADRTNRPNDDALCLFMCPFWKKKNQNWMWQSYSSFIYNQITPDVVGGGLCAICRLKVLILSTLMQSGDQDAFILH